jgi:hypothetical protein
MTTSVITKWKLNCNINLQTTGAIVMLGNSVYSMDSVCFHMLPLPTLQFPKPFTSNSHGMHSLILSTVTAFSAGVIATSPYSDENESCIAVNCTCSAGTRQLDTECLSIQLWTAWGPGNVLRATVSILRSLSVQNGALKWFCNPSLELMFQLRHSL